MKKTFILLTTLFAVTNAIVAPAQNPNIAPASPSTESIITVSGLKAFDTIEASGRMEIFVTIDPARPVGMIIELNGNDPNRLKWWDDDGVLEIKHTYTNRSKPVVIELNCHAITDLTLSGTSMTIKTPWVAHMVTIDLVSGAKLVATLEAFDLKISARMNSTAVITGNGTYADCFGYSSSVLDLRDYSSRSVSLSATGRAECFVRGTERLVIDALDASSVFYIGKPDILRLHETRGGHINPIGD